MTGTFVVVLQFQNRKKTNFSIIFLLPFRSGGAFCPNPEGTSLTVLSYI